MSSLEHIGVHLLHNKTVQTAAKGAATVVAGTSIGSVGIAAGSALSAVGATTTGGALASAGTSMLAGAAATLGGGTVAVTGAAAIATAATVVGTIAPFAAVGYGVYKLGKRLFT